MGKSRFRVRRVFNRPRRKAFSLLLDEVENRLLLTVFTVTNTGDLDASNNPVPGSLRAAIIASNHNPAPSGTNEIDFDISGTGVQTIQPASMLPVITAPVTINGMSQPGYQGTPIIQLSGTLLKQNPATFGQDGLTITTGSVDASGNTVVVGSTVEGLVINNFGGSGVHIINGAANTIENNFIGTDPTGTLGEGNVGNGVFVDNSPNNMIGGNTSTARNVISDNGKISINVPTSNSPLGGLNPVSVAAGDFNGDGVPDLVTANSGTGDLSILINKGNGTFEPAVNPPYNNIMFTDVVTGVFTGSGHTDIAAIVPGGVDVLLNNGDGTGTTFATPLFTAVGVTPVGIVAGNFNGDGNLDLAVLDRGDLDPNTGLPTGQGEGVYILPGKGDGTFGNPIFTPVGKDLTGIAAGKIDNNSTTDLVVSDRGVLDPNTGLPIGQGEGVYVLLGQGNGTFGNPIYSPAGVSPSAVAIGTFVTNGNPDIAVADQGTTDPITGTPINQGVTILLGDGHGNFQPAPQPQPLTTDMAPVAIVTGDFNGDGKIDVVTANPSGNDASFLQGNGNGTFQPATSIATDVNPSSLATGDFNHDGVLAYAVANEVSNSVTVVTRDTPAYGIYIKGAQSTNNLVLSNIIGADVSGKNALGNHDDGVRIEDASGNSIGASTAGAANLISGNTGNGVTILGTDGMGDDATDNNVVGNAIGADFTQTRVVSNARNGVAIINASNTLIGGTVDNGSLNSISGNGLNGILISGPGASGTTVLNNYIGIGNSDLLLPNGTNGIEIDGAPNNTIGGVVMSTSGTLNPEANIISGNKAAGILIQSSGATGNKVLGNDIGTDIFNNAYGNSLSGVVISNAPGNIVGGTTMMTVMGTTSAVNRNVISDNGQVGVFIVGTGATNNQVLGNFIGTDIAGDTANTSLGNRFDGVQIQDAPGTIIGGTAPGAGNVISSNSHNGIFILSNTTPDATGTVIQGNKIGTDATGKSELGNTRVGVNIQDSPGTIIGGTAPGVGNVISGNGQSGIFIFSTTNADASGTMIQGNEIGTDITGSVALGNTFSGVAIQDSPNTTIGGTAPGARNIISGNGQNGIFIFSMTNPDTTGTVIQGNEIGTDATGSFFLSNAFSGVTIQDSPGTIIGGTAPGAGNLISGNGQEGIFILSNMNADAAGTVIQGNKIGTDTTGTFFLGNALNGVFIEDSPNTIIGGTVTGAANVISGNGQDGVFILSDIHPGDATGTVIQGNEIGIGPSPGGAVVIANSGSGVKIVDSPNTQIGGMEVGAANVISGNRGDGVLITGAFATGNVVQGNKIGTDPTGQQLLGNGSNGVEVDVANNNTIGGNGIGNIIVGNHLNGVLLYQITSAILENDLIGVTQSGRINNPTYTPLGNRLNGVDLINDSGLIIGGPGNSNIIGGNSGDGVLIENMSSGIRVESDAIGTDPKGLQNLGNIGDGVAIRESSGNTVGGPVDADRNVINFNGAAGVRIDGNKPLSTVATTGNHVEKNIIGVNVDKTKFRANTLGGVFITRGANGNTIGGPMLGNVIAGNSVGGVVISLSSDGNSIQGNAIGLPSTTITSQPEVDLGNSFGVLVLTSSANLIGGTDPGDGNTIISSDFSGVSIQGNSSNSMTTPKGNMVIGNEIGTDTTGNIGGVITTPQPDGTILQTRYGNNANGVEIDNSVGNIIGGSMSTERNVISGNRLVGVHIFGVGSTGNVVQGNKIGTDATGTVIQGNTIGTNTTGSFFLGNVLDGVLIENASDNLVQSNTISGNRLDGVSLTGQGATRNLIAGNYIGTDSSGMAPLGNIQNGVLLTDAGGNTIGGTDPAQRNVISGNGDSGINITGVLNGQANFNQILGNIIGLNKNGTTDFFNSAGVKTPLGNGSDGVTILDGESNTIGGSAAGAGNVISGNAGDGVRIDEIPGGRCANNQVVDNLIGTDMTGSLGLGNSGNGVTIANVSGDSTSPLVPGTVVTLIQGNVVSGNTGAGIALVDATVSASVLKNRIGTDKSGTKPVGNSLGVFLDNAVFNTIGQPGAGNVISGNTAIGIQDLRTTVTHFTLTGVAIPDTNTIQSNFIGTTMDGTAPLGNGTAADGSGIGLFLNNARKEIVTGNVISGNLFANVDITGQGNVKSTDNQLSGNLIGTSVSGGSLLGTDAYPYTLPSPRQNIGVLIDNSTGNTIGPNQIAYNIAGVEITGSVSTTASGQPTVPGDLITGNAIKSNEIGVFLNQTTGNTVMANTITANFSTGITLLGTLTAGNLVQNNTIVQNSSVNPANGTGVYIEQAVNNVVQNNKISSNGLVGVYMFNVSPATQAQGNLVQSNTIIANKQYGIFLYNSGGNVPRVIMSGPKANILSNNTVANFREFTGTVLPRIGTTKSSKGTKVKAQASR